MTTWTPVSGLTTTWTNETTPLPVQPQTLYDDDNEYDVTAFGKGYYYDDAIENGAYTTASIPSTIWTVV